MIIGLDLSVIQTPHRMRGIGSTAINFVNNIPTEDKQLHTFVIFLYKEDQTEALKLLKLDGVEYELRDLSKPQAIEFKFPGGLKKLNGVLNSFRAIISSNLGDSRKGDLSGLDVYLQFDQMQPLPKLKNTKTAVILYDLIPYVMESDYLWNYRTARHNGDSRKSSIRKNLLRIQYLYQLKAVCRSADKLIAISSHTKNDFVRYVGVPDRKIQIIYLGINPSISRSHKKVDMKQYVENSWGYFPRSIDLQKKPFILFVGGADPRRRLKDLVAAFNNLRARGVEIQLVLAGDTMTGAHAIPVLPVQSYILSSSYLEDIIFLGFVTNEQREWLYENTVAMIYPSVYEGFGLPILEAMQYGTPVITYKNSSIHEIAGEAALYTEDAITIQKAVEGLLEQPTVREKFSNAGIQQSSKYSWHKTASEIITYLNS